MSSHPKAGITPLVAVVGGGLTAALLDILYAFAASGLRDVGPVRVLQSVASGLLGKASYQGGLATAALGGLLHAAIALVMAAVYVTASRSLPALDKRPWLWGPVYGLGCYMVMNYVVLAIRFGPRPTPELAMLLGGVAIHMFGVGLPIALFAARAALPDRTPAAAV
ncbi:hypothetical protein ASD79_13820 [Caulobacter sp. Root655]|uniref:hypothetical protein n=1 Tax=Caulobacter sp. Root655 TaxID=1736578 RepID=UPI0006F6D3E2|nr:hypothetical protein [Caulobacter sp. Root655]KRA58391.1 hypothetical protein ASD79_13820 [Caulobacter sp. Root655]